MATMPVTRRGRGVRWQALRLKRSHLPRRRPASRSYPVVRAIERFATGCPKPSRAGRCRIRSRAGSPRDRARAPSRWRRCSGFESSCGHAPFLSGRTPERACACERPHAGGATIRRDRYCLRPSDCSASPSGGTASGRRDYGVVSAPAATGASLNTLTTPQAVPRLPQCDALPAIATRMAPPDAIRAWEMPSGCRIARFIGKKRVRPREIQWCDDRLRTRRGASGKFNMAGGRVTKLQHTRSDGSMATAGARGRVPGAIPTPPRHLRGSRHQHRRDFAFRRPAP